MKSESIKDLRNIADLLAKDYQRLAEDMKALRECLNPVQVELAIMEEKKLKENLDEFEKVDDWKNGAIKYKP